jgi:general L-amino acid transport system permease protein
MMWFIVLPQALRLVIPGIVNTYVAIIKDTTLVLIIGLFDLLGDRAGRHRGFQLAVGIGDQDRLCVRRDSMGFWILCFGLSRYSMYLERRLATGHQT